MSLTKDQVKKVAKLANLPLTEGEEEKYTGQLSAILEYIDQLNSVDTTNIEPTFNVSGQVNIQAEDKVGDCLTQEEALANAPKVQDSLPAGRQGFFVTKGVFQEEI